MPKVSVIIPVYNPGKYFEECVRSLMEQTLDELELLFIDDGSTDGSMDTLRRIVNEYPDTKKTVRIIQNEINIGCCASRKKGVDLAQGQYIGFCDHDDYCDKEMFKTLYAKAADEDLDMVYCPINFVETESGKTRPIEMEGLLDNMDLIIAMLRFRSTGSYATLWNRIVKAEIIKNPQLDFPTVQVFEDCYLMCQQNYYSNSFGYVDAYLYNYRVNPDSVMNSAVSVSKSMKKVENAKLNMICIRDFATKKGFLKVYKNNCFPLRQFAVNMFADQIKGSVNGNYFLYKERLKLIPTVWSYENYNLRTKLSFSIKTILALN